MQVGCWRVCFLTTCGMWCCVACEDSLHENRLKEAGAAALAPALLELTALQALEYVCGCRAGDGGVLARAGPQGRALDW